MQDPIQGSLCLEISQGQDLSSAHRTTPGDMHGFVHGELSVCIAPAKHR